MDNNGNDDNDVYYCSHCLSLNIKAVMPGISYCKECNCGDILKTDFDEWEQLYQRKYGEKFLTKEEKCK